MKNESQSETSAFPKVTIGLPTYNGHGKIIRALNSVWTQQYPNLEVIISDNCSTDNTQQICDTIRHQHKEVVYFRQPTNIGLVGNFEFVLHKATGNFFMWLADDDTLEPDILKVYAGFLMRNPDYSLVSGKICYWQNNTPVFFERDFTLDDSDSDWRVARYYAKVVYGSLIHGMMRRELAERIPMRYKIGTDFHFVASLAYMAKVKNLEITGYNKQLNGTSRNSDQYAKVFGASWFSKKFMRMSIAIDAFTEIFRSPVYDEKGWYSKLTLALSCSVGVLFNYYGKMYPLIIGGKIKRYLLNFYRLTALKQN